MHWILAINLLVSVWIVFFQKKEPRAVWGWLLLLYFVPVIGFLMYIIVCQDYHRHKVFKDRTIKQRDMAKLVCQEDALLKNDFVKEGDKLEKYQDIIRYNVKAAGAVYRKENQVEIYTDGMEKFLSLAKEIEQAKRTVHIETYILRDDGAFHILESALKKAVENGAAVRILYDGMGGIWVRKKNRKRFHDMGFETAVFFPALFKCFQIRLNYRNHRKIAVIDGKVAFVGGFNIAKEYIGETEKYGYWRDTHLKITGESARDLNDRFILDWNCASKQKIEWEEAMEEEEGMQNEEKKEGMEEEMQNEERKKNAEKGKAGEENEELVGMQIISSGPDTKYPFIRDNFLKIIYKAKKHLYIQTPYFIPDEAICSAVKMAALSGVEVKLMIPCKPDHICVFWATHSHLEEMLQAGVQCYCYQNGFLHAKGIMADGEISSYGTANMDTRSFVLNFEVNAVLYNEKITNQLEEIFLEDIQKCKEITLYDYEHRSIWMRIREQASRLLSPLM